MGQLRLEAKRELGCLNCLRNRQIEAWLNQGSRLLKLDNQCQCGGLDFSRTGGEFATSLAFFGLAGGVGTSVDVRELIELGRVGASGADRPVGAQVEGGACMCLSDRQRQYEEQYARDSHSNTL